MRHLALVAVGALGKGSGGKVVMRTAKGGAAFGMASFRIRHLSFSLFSAYFCYLF
jgi:hypothetical protein